MSILDDAIREHLELKRAHGADEAEVKRLEDEAFGPAERPSESDPLAEAPTEFMTQPDAPAADSAEEGGRRINIADLQEPPPEPAPPREEPQVEATDSVEPEAEARPLAPAEDPAQAAPPAEEEPSAIEHEIVPEAEAEEAPASEPIVDADAGHTTEERHAIAEQPTELFDVEAEMGTEDAPAAVPSPSDEEIVETEAAEPKLAPVEPPTEIHAARTAPSEPLADEEEEEDEEFWSDQRLSEELDQALEAPLTDEHDVPAPTAEPASPLFDQAEEEDRHREPAEEPAPAAPEESAHDELAHQALEPKEPGHEDVLEDTPDFLEDAPEDDELWFEQRPPKDFDLD